MLLPPALDYLFIKKALLRQSMGVEEVFRPVLQRAAKPITEGYRKSLFGAINQVFGHMFVEDLTENPFAVAIPNFHMVG